MKQVKLKIFGRVQGVNFRYNVRTIAVALGLMGFVRNCDDGSVEVLAQGSAEVLREFILALKESSGLSKVEKVEENWESVQRKLKNFEIVREENFLREQGKNFRNLSKAIFSARRFV